MKQLLIIILMLTGYKSLSANEIGKKQKREEDILIVVYTARGHIGIPYRYGGKDSNGLDCSALIQNSFKSAGYEVPRTSTEQSKCGKNITWSNVREGDLVFFTFNKDGKKWNHSGLITLAQNGEIKFVHSSSSKGVVESDLLADYYKDNVIGFRRVIK